MILPFLRFRSVRAFPSLKRLAFRPRLEAFEERTLLSTVTWVGGSGDWDNPVNWSGGALPGPGDDAVIDTPDVTVTHSLAIYDVVHGLTLGAGERVGFDLSAGTLSLVDGALNDNSFTLSGPGTFIVSGQADSTGTFGLLSPDATLSGPGTLTAYGDFTWTGGIMDGTTTVAPGGSLALLGQANKVVRGTLNNAGTVTWADSGRVGVSASTVINNLPGALFDVQSDAPFYFRNDDGFAPHPFNNAGTFRKSAGSGVTTADAYMQFNNSGLVDVQTGTLSLQGGSATGRFNLEADATLDFAGDTYTFNDGSAVTGPGTLHLGGGTLTVNAPVSVPGVFQLDAGTLRGSAPLTVADVGGWDGGMISGQLSVAAGASFDITGTFGMILKGTLTNAGTVTWTSPGELGVSARTVIDNQAGALFDFQNDEAIAFHTDDGFAPYRLNNAGTIRKSASTGTSTFTPYTYLTNSGAVDVESGTLVLGNYVANLSGTTLTGGRFRTAGTLVIPGADIETNAAAVVLSGADARLVDASGNTALGRLALNAAGGQLTLRNGARLITTATFENAGDVNIGGGSTFGVVPAAYFTPGTYTQTAGTTVLKGGTLVATDGVEVRGGIFAGSGTVDADLRNLAVVHVGSEGPGVLTVTGNYSQDAGAVLTVRIGGPAAGEDYDQLQIQGHATLEGTLTVTLINGYVPPTGTPFEVLTYGSATGVFGIIDGSGPLFDPLYGPDGLTLVKN